ncbi:MAG: TonB family protein [Bacteroidales bacterium]|nr:TonB family protein [Bacteroidales bacterium]
MKTFFYILALMTIISCKPKIKQANDSVESPSSQILKDSIETKSDNFIITAGKIAKNESIYCIVEKMPSFVGGDTARIRYFDENIYYPKSAIDDSITGIVYVTFVINEDGSVSRVKIIRGLQHDIDNMCIKVVQNMPDWIPGEQMGKPVKVSFNMPFKFSFANRSKYQSNIISSSAKDPKK